MPKAKTQYSSGRLRFVGAISPLLFVGAISFICVRDPWLAATLTAIITVSAWCLLNLFSGSLVSVFLSLIIPFGWGAHKVFKAHIDIGFELKLAEVLLLVTVTALALVSATRWHRGAKPLPCIGPFGRAILLVLFGCLAHTLFSQLFLGGGLEGLKDVRPLLFYLYYFVFAATTTSKRRLTTVLKTLAFALATYGAITIIIAIARNDVFYEIYANTMWEQNRFRTGFSNGVMFVIIGPIIYVARRFRRVSFATFILFNSIIVTSIILSMARLLILSFSLAIFGGALLTSNGTQSRVRSIIYGTLLMLAASATMLASSAGQEFLERLLTIRSLGTDESVLTRLFSTMNIFIASLERPWFGHGLGTTLPLFGITGEVVLEDAGFIDDTFGTMFYKMGFFGVALLVNALYSMFRSIRYAYIESRDSLELLSYTRALAVSAPFFAISAILASANFVASVPVIVGFSALMGAFEGYLLGWRTGRVSTYPPNRERCSTRNLETETKAGIVG